MLDLEKIEKELAKCDTNCPYKKESCSRYLEWKNTLIKGAIDKNVGTIEIEPDIEYRGV